MRGRFWHRRALRFVLSRLDVSRLIIFGTEDIRFRGSLGKYAVGNREFGHYVDYIHYAFPDFNNVIEEIISEDNKSFVQLTYQGTHQGEIFGIRLPQMVKITAPKSAK